MNELDDTLTVILEITRLDIIKLMLPAVISFVVGILVSPLVYKFLAKFDIRKHKSVSKSIDGRPATLVAKLHNDEGRIAYRMGGLVALIGLFTSLALFRLLPVIFNDNTFIKLNFLSDSQTWLPLGAMFLGMLVGALDDLIVAGKFKNISRYVGDGLSLNIRMGFALIIAVVCAYWISVKLEMDTFYIPFIGSFEVVWWIFGLAVIAAIVITYAGGVIDGVDGLSGGVFSLMYFNLGVIAFLQERFDLAALCLAIVGGLLAFLWFNIPPARFYLSDVGSMPLTIGLAVISVLTDALFVLPIISLPLIVSIGSVVIQLISKKLRNGKKVFIAAPLHHHLELSGWPAYKVTMRYWVLTAMVNGVALTVFVLGGYFS